MKKKQFTTNDGVAVEISIDDEGEIIIVSLNGDELGTISLIAKEEEIGYEIQEHYYISDLSLEKCKGQGIGRACLKFHIESFGEPLTADSSSPFNTHKNEDGSHLIGDGPGFIQKMREEGIVCRHGDED